jgi:hypothetical protein
MVLEAFASKIPIVSAVRQEIQIAFKKLFYLHLPFAMLGAVCKNYEPYLIK